MFIQTKGEYTDVGGLERDGRRERGTEGGKERGREEQRKRAREGEKERERERVREGGREGGMEGGSLGGREGKEGERGRLTLNVLRQSSCFWSSVGQLFRSDQTFLTGHTGTEISNTIRLEHC